MGLSRCDEASRERSPRLVDGVFGDGFGSDLVGEIKDEKVKPVGHEDEGKSPQARVQIVRVVAGDGGTGERAEEAERRVGNDKGGKIALGKEPEDTKELERAHLGWPFPNLSSG